MGDPDIKEAMYMIYPPILYTYNGEVDSTGLLLFVLASIIYHSVWLKSIMVEKFSHIFSLIPLLNILEPLKILQANMDLKNGG